MEANRLNRVVAIMTYGRSGSGLMYSLLDDHPNVVSTPDCALTSFYDFWLAHGHLPATKLVPKFVDYYAGIFDAREGIKGPRGSDDFGEYAGFIHLGPNKDQCLKVDREVFAYKLLQIIGEENPVSRRLFFQGLHLAYAEAQGRKVEDPIIVFGLHTPGALSVQPLIDDFPGALFLQMVRRPVLSHGSLSRHHHLTGHGAPGPFGAFKGKIFYAPLGGPGWRGVMLEDLHEKPEETLGKICDWLEIPWHDGLMESTVNGLKWWNEKNTLKISGFNTEISSHDYQEYIPVFDRFRLEILLASIYRRWGYDLNPIYTSIFARLLVLPLLMLPFKMELISISDIESATPGIRGLFRRVGSACLGLFYGRKFLLRAWVRMFVARESNLEVL